MKPKNTLRNILIILLLLVLLPTVFYSVYEFSSLNDSEQILSEMYSRQLDAILYSVNEYAWTVVNNWTNTIAPIFESEQQENDKLKDFLQHTSAIQFLGFSDSTFDNISVIAEDDFKWRKEALAAVRTMLQNNKRKLDRLERYAKTGYRKLEPLYLTDTEGADHRMVLVFATNSRLRDRYVGIVLNEQQFIERVLGPKLIDVAGKSFVLGVADKKSNALILTTDTTQSGELKQQKPLWLLPGYELGIRLKGATIDELAKSRTLRNLVFIVLLDVFLIVCAWFVYRIIRREMQLVRVKSDFISNVSHELRTPLALIRMFGETLEMGRVKSDEKKMEYYSTIVKEAERLTRLVNNILDFSKMEAGKKQYNFRSVDVNTVIADVLNTYSYHLQSEGFSPQVSYAAKLPAISADVESVAEAVINLIDNAVKYSENEKSLFLRTLFSESMVVVEVEDCGIGIAEEHQKKIFDTFYRVSSGLVHTAKGSGLGLSLVKHIMEAHGGKVEVQSEVGKGSTFRLLFPIQTSSPK